MGGLRLEGLPEIGAHLSSYHIADALVRRPRPHRTRVVRAWYLCSDSACAVPAWCVCGTCTSQGFPRVWRAAAYSCAGGLREYSCEAYVSTLAQEAYVIDRFGEATDA